MIEEKYRKSPATIATYDFFDLASGTGIITFYAGKTVDLNLLSTSKFYSYPVSTAALVSGAAYAKFIDLDFDVIINQPTNLKGKTVVNIPMGIKSAGAGSTAGFYALVTVRKVHSAVESDIVTNTGTAFSINTGSSGTFNYVMDAIDVDVPQTAFAAGDTLRLTIEGWGKENVASNYYLFIGHDPMDRANEPNNATYTFGTEHSILIFQCPIDLRGKL